MKELTKDIMKKKYFIFDLDGTLIDSMGMWNLIDAKVILNNSGKVVDLMEIKNFRDSVIYNSQNVHGDIYSTYYQQAINHYGLDMTVDEYRKQRRAFCDDISANELDYKNGADEFLLILKSMGKRVGIASTTSTRQYEYYKSKNKKIVEKAPLKEIAEVVVLCEDVVRKKPDPEAYLKVLEGFGCSADECVVFEDSLNGIISAKDAGIEVVAVYDEFAENEQEDIAILADYKVASFNEIIETLGLKLSESQPE